MAEASWLRGAAIRYVAMRWTCVITTNDQKKGHEYEIYPQPEVPEMDMDTHLRRWLQYLESRLGRTLEPDDYIFPRVAINGAIHPKEAVSYDLVQQLLRDFTQGAGLSCIYTTHCFRRGGAQYRFMYAPTGKRWSLTKVRWWGGWAIGENVSHLMSRANMKAYRL